MVGWVGRQTGHRERQRQDAVHDTRDRGCSVCRAGAAAGDRWLTFYAIENHSDPAVIQRLRAARGFCAEHTRVVVGRRDAPELLTTAYADMVRSAADHDVADRPTAMCPVCDSARLAQAPVVGRVARWWTDEEVRSALRTTARICYAHLAEVLAACPSELRPAATADTVALLTTVDAGELIDVLAGQQPDQRQSDHPRRQPLVRSLAQQLDAEAGDPIAALHADLTRQCCPTCRTEGLAVVRYLRWLTRSPPDELVRLDSFDVSLCADHVADLAALDRPAAQRIVSAHRRGFGHLPVCPACKAGQRAAQRRTALLAALLDDRAFGITGRAWPVPVRRSAR